MIRRADFTASDANGTPEPGVYITVKTATGALATLFNDNGSSLSNPFQSGTLGAFVYNVATEGVYTEEYRLSLSDSPRKIIELELSLSGLDGLFINASSLIVPVGTDMVSTTGYSTLGVGSANYIYDATVNAAYVTANPRASFISANGRGFKLDREQGFLPSIFGAANNDAPDSASLAAFTAFMATNGNEFARTIMLPELASSAVITPPAGYQILYIDSADHTLKLKSSDGALAPPPPPIYPLDGAGTLPAFAYSTRKLTSTYAGSALRVVRPSDNTTLDVGFVGQDLDVAALDAFLGTEIGHVDKWYDQSGNANHAIQTTDGNRPLVENGSVEGGPLLFKNKRPIIFNEKFMNIPAGVTANRNAVNVFMAVEPIYSAGELGAFIQLGSGASQFTTFQQLLDLWGSAIPNLSKPLEQRPALIEVIGNGTTGTISQDFDSSTGAISAASLAGGMIGNTDVAGGYLLSGYASAVIGYGRVLSSGEGGVIRTAMRQLFNLVTTPNSGRVICIGDSIVIAGTGTAYGYGFMKMAQRSLPNDIAFYNQGQGGTQIQNKLATYATDGAGYVLQKYTDNRVVFMMYGTNDLTIGGRTAAQIYADIQTYAGYVRADGGKIIVCTILPDNSWNSTQQTTRTTLNTSIRTNWASFADGLCDFANNATMGPQAAAANTALYADGLHPTRRGHTYLKVDALAALAALL